MLIRTDRRAFSFSILDLSGTQFYYQKGYMNTVYLALKIPMEGLGVFDPTSYPTSNYGISERIYFAAFILRGDTLAKDGERTGLVQVYTGTGKGKTTAALGLVVRAAGKGMRALIIQFMKGRINYGELESIRHLPGAAIEQFGRPDFVNKADPADIDVELAEKGFARAREAIASGEYDLVVLDEMNVALDFGLLDTDEVLRVIENRPDRVEIVLTGRNAPPSIIAAADLVTDMTEVKHPFARGIQAREGIDL